jgi:hypothetical protein
MRTIRILAFQGTGLKYAGYLDPTDSPLLITGHVGLEPGTASIYGLHPPEWAIQEEGGPDAALQRLRGRRGQSKDMPGTIQDDTRVFRQAYERARNRPLEMRNLLVVFYMDYLCEDDKFEEIRSQLMEWYTKGTILRYGWPPIRSDTPFDNCVTMQRKLGMPITDFEWHKGFMDDYVKIFQESGHVWIPADHEE